MYTFIPIYMGSWYRGSYYSTELEVNVKFLCTLHGVVEWQTGYFRNLYGFMKYMKYFNKTLQAVP